MDVWLKFVGFAVLRFCGFVGFVGFVRSFLGFRSGFCQVFLRFSLPRSGMACGVVQNQ